jgi:hypothetical protein
MTFPTIFFVDALEILADSQQSYKSHTFTLGKECRPSSFKPLMPGIPAEEERAARTVRPRG